MALECLFVSAPTLHSLSRHGLSARNTRSVVLKTKKTEFLIGNTRLVQNAVGEAAILMENLVEGFTNKTNELKDSAHNKLHFTSTTPHIPSTPPTTVIQSTLASNASTAPPLTSAAARRHVMRKSSRRGIDKSYVLAHCCLTYHRPRGIGRSFSIPVLCQLSHTAFNNRIAGVNTSAHDSSSY